MPYVTLYSVVCDIYGVMSKTSYLVTVNSLVDKGYITKEIIGRRTIFTLTVSGKLVVVQFNSTLETLVKEYVLKYGNGL